MLVTREGKIRNPESEIQEDSNAPAAGSGDGSLNRFGNRSLAHSKIKRGGLKTGTLAPDFSLPRLDGQGDLNLSGFQGKRVLLVFSSPDCGPCNALAPDLEKFHRQTRAVAGLEGIASSIPNRCHDNGFGHATGTDKAMPSEWEDRVEEYALSFPSPRRESGFERAADTDGEVSFKPEIVMISRGDPKENRAKVKEHGLTFPIVLQQQWEISRRYAMFATPIAYLIDEQGVITRDVAVGVEPILALLREVRTRVLEERELMIGS
jgi:peroxiredoxin